MKRKAIFLSKEERIVQETLRDFYEEYPDLKKILYWSGCAYEINNGEHYYKPEGTATSTYVCDGCSRLLYCKAKLNDPIWVYNEKVAIELLEKVRLSLH